MTELRQIYKCDICGNIAEIINSGKGTLVCCGQNMTLLQGNTTEALKEKHIPVMEKIEGGIVVKVGSVSHPMEESHFIEWIEVQTLKRVYRKELKPGDRPEAIFLLDEEIISARAYCNLHGLWRIL